MRIDVVTIFPEIFQGPFEESIVRIARERGLVDLRVVDLREHAREPHRKVDDRPYGGGPGMVLSPAPVYAALESLGEQSPAASRDSRGAGGSPRYVLLTPQGERFTQARARELSREEHLILLCGHYEGFDERIRSGFPFLEISIGEYVLTGGEIPAMVLVDSVTRLVPGVVGHPESIERETFEGELPDHPHYTRPVEFRGRCVPEVLRSGNHREIDAWRRRSAEAALARIAGDRKHEIGSKQPPERT